MIDRTMAKNLAYLLFAAVFAAKSGANNSDLFNYGMETFDDNGDRSYGQEDWDGVDCDDLGECVRLSLCYGDGTRPHSVNSHYISLSIAWISRIFPARFWI